MEDSDQQSPHSGDLIGSNDDLLSEILLRLPVTSILRFKSVSKHCRWLLSHRSFTLRYDNNLSKSPGLFACNIYVPFDVENQSTPPFRSLGFYPDPYGIIIKQSCNGLLLCCSDRVTERDRTYYVFNPSTKQFAIIPSVPGGQDVSETILSLSLAFQTNCVHYKVVCLRRLETQDTFQIQIYSSDTGKWKISIESFSTNCPFRYYGVYCNGAIHWHPSLRYHLFFKLEVEQLQTVPLPVQVASTQSYYENTSPLYFGESKGRLHLVTDHKGMDSHINVYEMLSDHSGWFVKHQVQLEELRVAFPEGIYPTGYNFSVIDVVRGEKDEDTFMVMTLPMTGKIIRYNVHDKCFKHIFNFTTEMFGRGYLKGYRYTEALAYF